LIRDITIVETPARNPLSTRPFAAMPLHTGQAISELFEGICHGDESERDLPTAKAHSLAKAGIKWLAATEVMINSGDERQQFCRRGLARLKT
jgi:hypothetical protein